MSTIDYESVIAALEAKRDKITAAIDVLLSMSGNELEEDEAARDADAGVAKPEVTARGPRGPRSAREGGSVSGVQNDTFFGLSTPEAIRKFLTMTKRPQKIPDISKALLDGGQIHARDATTAYNNVYSALKRMRKANEAVRIKSGEWAMAEWYASNKPKSEGE